MFDSPTTVPSGLDSVPRQLWRGFKGFRFLNSRQYWRGTVSPARSAPLLLRSLGFGFLVAATIANSSCSFRKAPRAFNPPPLAAKPTPPAPPPILPLPGEDLSPAVASLPPANTGLPTLTPPPVAPAKPRVAAGAKAIPPPQPQPGQPVEPAPRLQQIYTAEQQREYNRTIDESLDSVRKNLERIAGKRLTPEQSQTAESIKTFQKQAEQAREQDLLTAANLARRADLLAKDLLTSLP